MAGVPNPATSGSVNLALFAPLRRELVPTAKLLGLRRSPAGFEGVVAGKRVVASVAGMGGESVQRALHRLHEQHQPDHLMMIGFAGGLDRKLTAGAVIRVRYAVNESDRVLELSDVHAPREIADTALTHDRNPDQSVLTAEQPALSLETKQALHRKYRCAAVDMETCHAALMAQEWGVPLTVLRAVSDTADTTLPAQTATWMDADGRVHLGVLLRDLICHPSLIPQVAGMRRDAVHAAEQLALSARDAIHKLLGMIGPTDTPR